MRSSGLSLLSRGLRLPRDIASRGFNLRRRPERSSCSSALPTFGPEIDPIVEAAKAHAILTRRDPARLNAILDFPRQSMTGWHLLDDTDRLRGLAVLNVIPKDQGRTRTGKIVDCLLDDIDIDLWHAAMLALTHELARQGADLAQAYASTPWTAEALAAERLQIAVLGEVPHPRPTGIDSARCDISPHAAGGRLCLHVMTAFSSNDERYSTRSSRIARQRRKCSAWSRVYFASRRSTR